MDDTTIRAMLDELKIAHSAFLTITVIGLLARVGKMADANMVELFRLDGWM